MIKISVVVPTYNRLAQLKQVLAGLEAQTMSHNTFEVIVVSDGSTDGTEAYLQTMTTPLNLRRVMQQNQGVAAARNCGVRLAQSALILFVDDDVVPSPQLLSEHYRMHQLLGQNVVVIGPMLTPPDFKLQPWVQWMQDRLSEQYEAMVAGAWAPTARQFYTGNTSLARQLLIESGGFDASFRRAEDVELAFRLADKGVRFHFHAPAVGFHYEKRPFASWLAIPLAYGRNDVIFAQQKGQTWLFETIFREYGERHWLIRGLTRLCLNRVWLYRPMTGLLQLLILAADRLHLGGVTRIASSILFNYYHYQGIADMLGERRLFFWGVNGRSAELLAKDIRQVETVSS